MAKSTEERLEEAIGAAASLAYQLTDGAVTAVTFDVASSSEVPYRLEVPEETLPLVGMARREQPSDRKAGNTTSVAGQLGRGDA